MQNFTDKLKNLAPGDHLCCLYDTEEEHRKLLTPFLIQGIEQYQKAVYIVDARTADEVLDYLRGSDINVEQAVEKGQLWILSARESYLKNGVFDPDAMIDILRAETRRAIEEGYDALRVTGEMSWALQDLPGTDRLIEYENKLNEFFAGSRALALCQYDRRRFQAATLLNILRTHPVAVIGTEIYANFYYIPPAELTGEVPEQRELANWIENLSVNKQYEEELRRSRDELEQRVQERTNQVRSLAVQLVNAKDQERERLAGIMHDDLQQQLAALRLKINLLMSGSKDDAETKSQFQEMIDLVDDAIEQTRSLSHELSPANLQLHGLFNALNNLAEDMYEKHGLEVHLDLEPEAEPKKDNIVSMLYRALKELMFNVVKHSGRKEAWLKVKRIGDETCFSITDKGKGMTLEELHSKREIGDFLGLFGIEQRLIYLGGRMEIESSKEEGMRIILALPTDKAKGLRAVEDETQSPALRNSFTSISE